MGNNADSFNADCIVGPAPISIAEDIALRAVTGFILYGLLEDDSSADEVESVVSSRRFVKAKDLLGHQFLIQIDLVKGD